MVLMVEAVFFGVFSISELLAGLRLWRATGASALFLILA